jgi:hypothetical protein
MFRESRRGGRRVLLFGLLGGTLVCSAGPSFLFLLPFIYRLKLVTAAGGRVYICTAFALPARRVVPALAASFTADEARPPAAHALPQPATHGGTP